MNAINYHIVNSHETASIPCKLLSIHVIFNFLKHDEDIRKCAEKLNHPIEIPVEFLESSVLLICRREIWAVCRAG